ncbi:MAG: N-6 DNA methylase, partial [SAR324 cluster bacterium]|nr:N-6 DNA methylase [SAR324 cluster bacterium]
MKSGEMLTEVYDKLDFEHGQLFDVMGKPSKNLDLNTWLNKGGWLTAAEKAGAEKVFFVDNNPVVIFAKYTGNEEEKNRCFNRLWSLARPRILFLEGEGELSVIDLAQKPVHQIDKDKKVNSLETLNKIQEVAAMLQTYHRDNIESGKVFEKGRFGDLKHRADQSLISDLKTIRNELIAAGLNGDNLQYAHALIGRSIFIRYLEDRGFLTDIYFEKVARQKTKCAQLLNNPTSREAFDFSKTNARYRYPRVLQDQEFTYAFFRALSKDFNGDMFPNVDREEKIVKQEHLDLIQELLYGDVGVQKKLFFFSYQFDII